MAHTTKIQTEDGEVAFIHNSDMSGSITIISDTGEQANIPFSAITGFYASYIRHQKIVELSEMSDEAILELRSPTCDYCLASLSPGGGRENNYGIFCSRQCVRSFMEEFEEDQASIRVKTYSGLGIDGTLTELITATVIRSFEINSFGTITIEGALNKIVSACGVPEEFYYRGQVMNDVSAKFPNVLKFQHEANRQP